VEAVELFGSEGVGHFCSDQCVPSHHCSRR
jgi:hypothetical protein